jgi:hypothetical protein
MYKYDLAGKQAGYQVFDANGRLISGTVSPTPTSSPSKNRNALGR